jgi:6-pyruvoyltetrahydropterin/6-carboxytetrahydropterin synthase
MFTISKQFTFSASHQLDYLPAPHPCARLHGHNYTVEVVLRSPMLDEHDFVLDYNELRVFNDWLTATFDHRHLNDVLPGRTTAENIARYLYKWVKERQPLVLAVKVSETPKTWATYEE